MRTRLFTLAFAALLSSCGSNDPTALGALAGNYQLVSVNGYPLPAITFHEYDYYTVKMLGGLLTLKGDGTFTAVYETQKTNGGVQQPSQATTCQGTWTRSGRLLTLTETPSPVCDDEATADWDGSRKLTVTWRRLAVPLVHRR